MKLVVGFLTYNDASAKYLADFLPSLKEALYFLSPQDYQVLAFDNSDLNQAANRLALEHFSASNGNFLEYLSADSNLGFSRAYNLLIRQAIKREAQYFLVVNPDTILEKDTLKELVTALDQDNSLSAVGPKIRRWDFLTNTKTRIIDSCGLVVKPGLRFFDLGQGVEDDKRFDKAEIIGPSGAAGLFRLSSLEKIKEDGEYFDERFFMYKEDCDLAYRLFLAQEKAKLVPTAIMYHDRTAASSGKGMINKIVDRQKKSRQVRAWSTHNQIIISIKHWSKQNFISRLRLIFQILFSFIFSLILEQFLVKEYFRAWRATRVLTNVK